MNKFALTFEIQQTEEMVGPISISEKTSLRKISWSLEATGLEL